MYKVQNVKASHLQGNLTQREYLKWINALLNTSYKKLDDLSTGSAYCRIINQVFPACVDAKKIKRDEACRSNSSFCTRNFQLLNEVFKKLGVKILIKGGPCQGDVTTLEVSKLVKPTLCVPANYKFIQWFKLFCDANSKEIKDLRTMGPVVEKRESLPKTLKSKVRGISQCGGRIKMPKALKHSITVSNTDHKIENIEVLGDECLITQDTKTSSLSRECLESNGGKEDTVSKDIVMSESVNINDIMKHMENMEESLPQEGNKETTPTSKQINFQPACPEKDKCLKTQETASEDTVSTVKKSLSLDTDTVRDEMQFMKADNEKPLAEAKEKDKQKTKMLDDLRELEKTGQAIKVTSEETEVKSNEKIDAIKQHMLSVREKIRNGEKPASTLRSSKSMMSMQTVSEKEKLKIILRELRASRKSRNMQ